MRSARGTVTPLRSGELEVERQTEVGVSLSNGTYRVDRLDGHHPHLHTRVLRHEAREGPWQEAHRQAVKGEDAHRPTHDSLASGNHSPQPLEVVERRTHMVEDEAPFLRDPHPLGRGAQRAGSRRSPRA